MTDALSPYLEYVGQIVKLQQQPRTKILPQRVSPSMGAMLLDQLSDVQCSHINIFRTFNLVTNIFDCRRIESALDDEPDESKDLTQFSLSILLVFLLGERTAAPLI